MFVSVVDVRIVWVGMAEILVSVRVGGRLAGWVTREVLVSVVLFVNVQVVVHHRLVDVLVLVPLGQMEPHTDAHLDRRDCQRERHRLAEKDQGQGRPDEWGERKIGPSPGRAQVPEREDEQHQAQPVAEKAHHAGANANELPHPMVGRLGPKKPAEGHG
jgi:hypothetical protein